MHPIRLTKPRAQRRSRRKPLFISLFFIALLAAYSAITITRPFSTLQPVQTQNNLRVTTPAASLPWPAYGQGALGLSNGTVVATNGEQTKVPIASAAKVITALLVLEKYPLNPGADGPRLVMTENDVALYREYVAKHGSVTPVAVGQTLTERQMLQALLLPSANNIADTLAIWSYGSIDNYVVAANKYLSQHGLAQTTVGGDASGYLPTSVSTAGDLVKLGGLAMNHPIIAEIVGQKVATIPGSGLVTNYNNLLGMNNIVGIKTGNNDENGGVFIGAARVQITGKSITIISALSGAQTLGQVLRDSRTLLSAAQTNITNTTIVNKGAVLGTYQQPNAAPLQAVAAQDVIVTTLRGNTVKAKLTLRPVTYKQRSGSNVGTVTVPATTFSPAQTSQIILKQSPAKPSLLYRLLHP